MVGLCSTCRLQFRSPNDMYRSGRHDEMGEEEIELLPTSSTPDRRRYRAWRERTKDSATHRALGAIALVGILVFGLLLPSPLSWDSSEVKHRNGTRPWNITYGSYYPRPESALLQGTLEGAALENKDLTSSIFVPFPVRECTVTTPAWFAPCAARRTLIPSLYAEELLYPDFGLALPIFANEEQRALWLEAVEKVDRMRFEKRGDEEYMLYRGQHGQNFVSPYFRQQCYVNSTDGGDRCCITFHLFRRAWTAGYRPLVGLTAHRCGLFRFNLYLQAQSRAPPLFSCPPPIPGRFSTSSTVPLTSWHRRGTSSSLALAHSPSPVEQEVSLSRRCGGGWASQTTKSCITLGREWSWRSSSSPASQCSFIHT